VFTSKARCKIATSIESELCDDSLNFFIIWIDKEGLIMSSNGKNDADKMATERAQEQESYRLQCNQYVESGLQSNVTIQFLIDRLVGMGCAPPKGFIKCMDCGDKMAGGGFGVVEETVVESATLTEVAERAKVEQCHRTEEDLKKQLDAASQGKVKLRLLPEVFLCQQHLRNETHAHEAMVHELIHAIDLCRTKMDPLKNCMHMACTEIRAENLSGECDWMRELGSGRVSTFAGHGAECVKRRSALSVQANPNCKDNAKEYVEAAFDRCHRDTFPFDRHPNLR
jgi:inner membrane protease ATP23